MSASGPRQFGDVAEVYDSLMSVVPYRQWVDYVERLWEQFEVRPRRILDLACGTGNVTRELARRGYDVVGVDYSASMVRVAQEKAPELTFYVQDARLLDLSERFDACVCLFDSLNYILETKGLTAAFAGVRRHLEAPKSVLVFDMNAIHALESGMFNQAGSGRDSTLKYHWRSHWDAGERLCRVDMQFQVQEEDGTREFTESHWQRGYTVAEVTRALTEAGLRLIEVFDAFTFRAPRASSDRLYFIAESV